MHRFSQFGLAALAILLIAAVAQCAVVCQLAPAGMHQGQSQKAETKVPPCHKQSKSSKSPDNCSHPQAAMLASVSNQLDFGWAPASAALPGIVAFAAAARFAGQRSTGRAAVTLSPPLCLRV